MAMDIAGYAPSTTVRDVTSGLQEEILQGSREYLAANAPKAAIAITGVIDDPDTDGTDNHGNGPEEWKALLGGETLSSKFQDGHYVYSIVAGGGSGDAVYPPVLYVADIEN